MICPDKLKKQERLLKQYLADKQCTEDIMEYAMKHGSPELRQ